MEDYDLALRLALAGPWAFITDPLVTWHEDAGIGLSRNLSQLDKCQHAFQILNDLSHSTQFGPLLPKALLQHRLRFMKRTIDALVLAKHPSHVRAVAGKLLLLALRIHGAIYRRLPSTPRMATRAILSHPESSSLEKSEQQCLSVK